MPFAEKDIITSFNNARPEAFNTIFDLYYSRIYYFAYKLLANREDAEDIASESFYKLFKRRERFVGTENIEAFLFVATRNACFNLLKHRKLVKQKQNVISHELESDNLDYTLIEAELLRAVYKAIESLPPERGKVLKMLYVEGLKIVEVAEKLGISENTVKSHRAKAILSLRDLFSQKELAFCWLLLAYPFATIIINTAC